MKKILCIHQSSELYGSDRSFYSAIQGLKDKWDITIVLPSPGELSKYFEKEKASISYFNKGILRKKDILKPLSFLGGVLKGVRYYAKEYKSYDLIYINTIVMLSAIIAACFHRNKKIYCHVREIPDEKLIYIFRLLFKISGVSLIYNSAATKNAFGLPGTVIYNGVPAINHSCENFGRDGFVRILLIGRINTWKGQSFFIDALLSYSKKFKHLPFSVKIVGSAFTGYEYLEHQLHEKILAANLEKSIELVPFANNPSTFFQWADYVIVPSTKPEPFGRVAVEAFSAGKPVIAANHGGLREIVDDKVNGYFFEPNNIESLVLILDTIHNKEPSTYRLMCENANSVFEQKFSLKKYQESISNTLN